VTKVLVTSFNIKAMPGDKTILVDVKTGRTAAYSRSSNVIKRICSIAPVHQAIRSRHSDEILQRVFFELQLYNPFV